MDEIKTVVIKWNHGNESGVYKYTMEHGLFREFKVSGKDIPWSTFIELAMKHESFAAFREAAKASKRSELWNVSSRDGMSGCRDLTINYLDKKSKLVLNGGSIHISMNDKVTINPARHPTINQFDNAIWIRDLYDLIYWCEHQYCFQGNAEDLTEEILRKRIDEFEDSNSTFVDMSTYFEQKETTFRNGGGNFESACFAADSGYGDDFVERFTEPQAQDYSDYDPEFDKLSVEEQEAIIYKEN